MSQAPIRMSYITSRKNSTKSKLELESKVTPTMYFNAKSRLNIGVVTEFARKVSERPVDCNEYWGCVLELAEKLDKKENKSHPQLYNIFMQNIVSKIDKTNLKNAIVRIENSDDHFLDKEAFKTIISDNLVIDRILTNDISLSKRFNFNKIAKESVLRNKCIEGIYEMYDLINTYDISTEAKFNIALENIMYNMESAGYNGFVAESVVDYFLMNNTIIPDCVYETVQNLVKNSRLLSDEDKEKLSYFTEAKNDRYKNEITYLAYKCQTEEAKELIIKSISIKTEKEASQYIKKAVSKAENSLDSKHIISSIFAIPLRGKISKPFVLYQYRLATDKNKLNKKLDKNFERQIEEILDDEDDTLLGEALLLNSEEDIGIKTVVEIAANDSNFPNTLFMESEDFGDSEDIKEILNDFKSDQKKSLGKFKYYLGKIYRKSPESIIDATPNIFSIIRVVFILGPSVVPIVGPITSLILAFIDRIISMKINEKQTENLIRKLEAEKDRVEKDIEKKQDKKNELEKYSKCIDSCIKRVDVYREKITSDPIENRKPSSPSLDDDFNFDMDDDLDFKLESALVAINAVNTILEGIQNDLTNKAGKIFSEYNNLEILSPDNFKSILEVCNNCGRSIDMRYIISKGNEFKSNMPLLESVQMGTTLGNMKIKDPDNTLAGLFTEAYFTEQLQEVINEGFNLNKLKLLFQVAKSKAKDVSTKEKAFWKNMDVLTSGFMKNVEKAMTSDRREGIIKGSIIPSFSRCMKSAMTVGAVSFINPVLGLITAMGMIGVSKKLNNKERQLIYDEIDTELKVVEKEIEMANNDGDMKKYRCMLQYQKRLERERQRIKYGLKVHGRNIPMYDTPKGD